MTYNEFYHDPVEIINLVRPFASSNPQSTQGLERIDSVLARVIGISAEESAVQSNIGLEEVEP